jgi:hypothetical protein
MKTYKVKIGYRVNYEIEVEVDAETHILAMDRASEQHPNPDTFKEVFATKPAVLSVWEKK